MGIVLVIGDDITLDGTAKTWPSAARVELIGREEEWFSCDNVYIDA
jgi:hypothetical protein